MASYDWRTGTYAIDPQGRGNFHVQQENLKGQKFTIVRYFDTAAVNMGAGDDFKVIGIDAGVLVESIKVLVVTAEGATATIDIGDSAGGTTFDDAMDVNAAAGTLTATADLAYKYYSAADYLLITPNNALDAAKFYVIVDCVRLV